MKFIREPLVHFLLLGAAIFVVYSFVSKDTEKPGEILITQGKIENMVTTFSRTWQRQPTEQELNGLIQDYLREEVAYREAKSMGLDQDDTIIRRRLRQKLEFVSEDIAGLQEPTDADLEAYLKSHAKDFQTESSLSFVQVYLNPEKHGANLKHDAEEVLARLQAAGENVDVASFGDTFLLEHEFANVTEGEVKRLFGEDFAMKLLGLEPGRWEGPVESGYGAHLVFVRDREKGRLPALNEAREEVRREWKNAKRVETMEKFYQSLLARYKVIIETPAEKKITEKP